MGGIADALFGTEGEPAQVIDTQATEFMNLRRPVAQGLQQILGDTNFVDRGGVQPGQTAPLGDREQAMLDRIFQQTTATPQATQQAQQTLSQTAAGNFLSPGSNPFLAEAIEMAQRPIRQQFEEQIMPRLRGEFTRAGQFVQPQASSPFDMAVARAGSGFMDAIGDVGTRMAFENYAQERDRMQQAAQTLPAFDRAELERTIQGLEAQALPRLIEEMGIERGMEMFRTRMATLLQALQLGGQLSTPMPAQVGGTEGTPGLLGGVLQGAAPAIGSAAAGALFSDRRVKTDIKPVGSLSDGLTVYQYAVPWLPMERIGLMADEVESVYPEAVSTHSSGLQMVDYGAVPTWPTE